MAHSAPVPETSPQEGWILRITHPDSPNLERDFSEFAIGISENDLRGSGEKQHGRYRLIFSGRPGLLADLMTAIRDSYTARPYTSAQNLCSSMRSLWRFLDDYENRLAKAGTHLPRIDRLHQITGPLLDLWSQPGPNASWDAASEVYSRTVRRLILDAIEVHGLPPVRLVALRVRSRTPKDTLSEDAALALIRFLAKNVAAIFRRWKRADSLAASGRDLLSLLNDQRTLPLTIIPTEADAHATYRALVERTGNPLPSLNDLWGYLGEIRKKDNKRVILPHWWPTYPEGSPQVGEWASVIVAWNDCAGGLYPSTRDLSLMALLCLARSAWNPSTLLRLNVDDWHNGYDEDHMWVFAQKNRSGKALQYTVSASRHTTGIYSILSRLAKRSAPIRAMSLASVSEEVLGEQARQSIWHGFTSGPSVKHATLDYIHGPKIMGQWLNKCVEQMNTSPSNAVNITHTTPGDFRDIAAAIMYRASRYSMWTMMVMLGHKNIATTRLYGFRRHARQESNRLVVKTLDDVFQQIKQKKAWEASITRARLEGIDITPEALERLAAYRRSKTYSGAYCSNPSEPPPSIDPNHPRDGRTRCVQGHLCIARACPQAVVISDSLEHICKTVAELEWRQANTGIVRFWTGSEDEDLFTLKKILRLWPADVVDRHLAAWRNRIATGAHFPTLFAGQH